MLQGNETAKDGKDAKGIIKTKRTLRKVNSSVFICLIYISNKIHITALLH